MRDGNKYSQAGKSTDISSRYSDSCLAIPSDSGISRSLSIDYFEIAETEPVAMANRIKEVLRKRHIFIRSDSGEDIQICRERFFAWKESRK